MIRNDLVFLNFEKYNTFKKIMQKQNYPIIQFTNSILLPFTFCDIKVDHPLLSILSLWNKFSNFPNAPDFS